MAVDMCESEQDKTSGMWRILALTGGALLLIAFGYRMEKRTEDWLQNGQDVGEGLSAEERINQLPLIARLTSRSVRRHSDSFVH
mmetsp:Transcript_91573/g.261733  ORF Transcript_91573/g.261733 Transcript_91573/m.261733 type:complete len:84 (-) Transcript_91573:221-472(-)